VDVLRGRVKVRLWDDILSEELDNYHSMIRYRKTFTRRSI
jgi:hypothetical protein